MVFLQRPRQGKNQKLGALSLPLPLLPLIPTRTASKQPPSHALTQRTHAQPSTLAPLIMSKAVSAAHSMRRTRAG